MYKIYLLNSDQRDVIEKILKDDFLGRQSIIQKDGSGYGYDKKIILVIEGQDNIFKTVSEVAGFDLKSMDNNDGEVIYNKIKSEQEAAEGGVGFLFG
jgi:hypothetical protein